MATLNIPIVATADDATENSSGAVSTVFTALGDSLDAISKWVGLRFQNVTIPQGSIINSASISVVPFSSSHDEPLVTIFGEDTDDAAAFVHGTTNTISTRARTTASVAWSSTNLGATGTSRHNSPDLATIIQEIVDRPGWVSGNALNILIQGGDNSLRDLQFYSFDNGSLIPELDIDYTPAVPAGAPADIQFEGFSSAFTMQIATGAPMDIQFEGLSSAFTMQIATGAPMDIQFTGFASTYSMFQIIAAGAPADITWQGFASAIATVDMVVEVSLSNLSGDTDEECGVVFRLVDASNFLCAYVDDGDNLVHLSAFEGGVERSIATAAWTPADTAEIRVICQGDRIRVWVDRVLVIDVEDGWLVYANRAGLFSRSTAVVQFGDFYAQLLSEVA